MEEKIFKLRPGRKPKPIDELTKRYVVSLSINKDDDLEEFKKVRLLGYGNVDIWRIGIETCLQKGKINVQ